VLRIIILSLRVAHESLFLGMFDLSKNTMNRTHSRISRSPLSLLIFWIMFTATNSDMLNLAAPYPCGKGTPRSRNMRIIGGKPAFPGQFPWAVSLRKRTLTEFAHECAGSLITAKHVVTAAHCIHETTNDSWEVVAGEHRPGVVDSGEQIRKVEAIAMHPDYIYPELGSDLALLTLSKNVSWSSLVGPICLPSNKDDFAGSDATIAGWGKEAEDGKPSELLRFTKVPVMKNDVCKKWIKDLYGSKYPLDEKIEKTHLCTGLLSGGRDGCKGDSGGPLTLEEENLYNMLIGIVSMGSVKNSCGRPSVPGIYTRVSEFSSWLKSEVG